MKITDVIDRIGSIMPTRRVRHHNTPPPHFDAASAAAEPASPPADRGIRRYRNEYFEFAGADATLNAAEQVFQYQFLVTRPLPASCWIFEHFVNERGLIAGGEYPLVPTTHWPPGLYTHRTRQFLPEGDYDWWVGLDDGDRGRRIPIENTVDNEICLGRVHVGPLSISAASQALRAQRTALPYLHLARLPVYVSEDLGVVASVDRGENPRKVAVISMAKAGTYLLELLLRQCGFSNCGLHLGLAESDDYRQATMVDTQRVRYRLRAHNTTQLVTPGQSIVGHLPHCPEALVALDGFEKMFVYRNIRDLVVSYMRFELRLKRPFALAAGSDFESLPLPQQCARYLESEGKRLQWEYGVVMPWRSEPGIQRVGFEELLGDYGKARQHDCVSAIFRHVGVEIATEEISALMQRVIGQKTLTYSGRRSDWRQYWSDEVERRFEDVGLRDLNRRLGYADPARREPPQDGSGSDGTPRRAA